ncbi:OmpP1/FadL family transporter [Algibacillus agarilyticus]|uniref:OmpP1/FadL family transporter n=1 Tax=Algibacillus agarilyticus TaxID=2234133 RepID=UPI000DD07E45|nr:outer membrane protein transport protein [Algibacillus agarilyticus]
MNYKIGLVAAASLISGASVGADRLEIPSSFNPVGSGARALGQGGSFIATADDASAASWNPGALTQLRQTEIAAMFSHTQLSEDNSFSSETDLNGKQDVSNSELNYLAFSMPCRAATCGKNMVFSVNYQRLYDFSREWKLSRKIDDGLSSGNEKINYEQDGSLYALGLAAAVQLTDNLSVGLTVNFWEDFVNDNEWTQNYNSSESVTQIDTLRNEDAQFTTTNGFTGTNFNLGLLWDVYQQGQQKLTIGAVYKSAFEAEVNQTSQAKINTVYPELNGFDEQNSVGPNNENLKIDMPSSIGLGVAFQWNDSFTTSLDVYQTAWSDFVLTDQDGNKRSPLSGKLLSTVAQLKDTTQIRLGGEYRIISQKAGSNYIIPIRAGLFIDPAAAEGETDDTYGFSVGTGIAYQNWVFDVAYQHRIASDIGQSAMQSLGYKQDITEHLIMGSVFYRY